MTAYGWNRSLWAFADLVDDREWLFLAPGVVGQSHEAGSLFYCLPDPRLASCYLFAVI